MPRYRTLGEVAKELRVSPQTLRRRVREAGLSPYRPGRGILLSHGDVLVLLEESRSRAPDPPPHPKRPPSLAALAREHSAEIAVMPRPLREVAAQFGISVPTLRRRMAEAGIRPPRVGRAPMLRQSDIAKLIEESRFRERAREMAAAPRPPLPREEIGRRIAASKAQGRRIRAKFGI